jgi:molybdopterin molybdotransferase
MAPPSPLAVEEARRIVLAAVSPLPGEHVELGRRLLGRILARDVVASEPVPSFDSSAMDGYALRSADVEDASDEQPPTLRVVGESRAGAPAEAGLAAGEAIAISTGAAVPAGADAVVRVEDTDGGLERVAVCAPARPGENIRLAGEDVQPGVAVLRAGATVGPAELGVLASLGVTSVLCARRPRVAIVTTGDELLEPGEPMRAGGVRNTNGLTVSAMALLAGAELADPEHARDDPDAVAQTIGRALEADVAIVCGGVSVGRHDHVRRALAALGARQSFWGLALRPGHPTWFGTAGRTLVFGLPGNPVSAMVTFRLLVAPALRALTGAAEREQGAGAVLDQAYEKQPGRMHAVRVRLRAGEDGWHAQPMPAQGSHVLTSMLGADALALVPAEAAIVRAGERVRIEPLWEGVEGRYAA